VTVVDYHSHWYPESYLISILDAKEAPRTTRIENGYLFEGVGGDVRALTPEFFDLDVQFAKMDEVGIDIMVCSPNLVGDVVTLDVSRARDIVEMLAEEYSAAQRKHPDRFVGLAMVPLQDPEVATELLDRAITGLDLKGVCLVTHVAGEPIASDATRPFYAKAAELDVPVFMHPSHRSSVYREGQPRPIEAGLNWIYDSSAAALSLIFSGTLDAHPELEIVHPHLGGALPYVIGRIDQTAAPRHMVVEELPATQRTPSQYLRDQFFADTVSQTPGVADLAIRAYGRERLLFGTDFPWQQPRADRVNFVREQFDTETAELILHGNSLRSLQLPVHAGHA
jgi:aminocarboxymuconate-semialdehyde decarboxylase